MHGIYDYCLFTGNFIFTIIFYIFVFIVYIITLKRIKRLSSINRKMKYKDNYCAYDIENSKKLNKTYKTLKYTANDLFIVRSDKNYGIIDINGKSKIKQEYANINYYEEIDEVVESVVE